jgi:hypothetical protein
MDTTESMPKAPLPHLITAEHVVEFTRFLNKQFGACSHEYVSCFTRALFVQQSTIDRLRKMAALPIPRRTRKTRTPRKTRTTRNPGKGVGSVLHPAMLG